MTIAELKALAPLVDTYEFTPGVRYLFVVPRGPDDERIVRALRHGLSGLVDGRSTILVMEHPEDLRILDINAAVSP